MLKTTNKLICSKRAAVKNKKGPSENEMKLAPFW